MSEIKKLEDSKIVRLVGSDAEYIKNEIDQANKAFGKSLEHYRNAGERLAAVRDDMKAQGSRKGKGFSAWIEQNCGLTKTHAYRYISLFENWDNLVTLMLLSPEVFSLTDALKAIKDINAATLEAQDDAIDTIATEVQEKLNTELKKIEIEGAKAKWRKLNWKQKKLEENQHLKLSCNFVEYITQKINFDKKTVYNHMAIAQGWEEYKLYECKTLTEALERMGKINQRSKEIEADIKADEKYSEELDRLSSQPETIEVIKDNPDLKQKVAFAYAVGFWWLSLDERTKTEQLEKHPVFAERYSFETCKAYGSICSRIPTWNRFHVIKSVVMKVSKQIVDATSDQKELEMLFDLAIATGISARNMQIVITEWKQNKSLGETIINQLPNVLEGDRKDKTRFVS